MNCSPIRRKTAVLLLLGALLATPWAAAVERGLEPTRVTAHALLARLWERLAALWDEAGSGIDPDGGGADSPAGEEPAAADHQDAGSGIDPYGGK